MVFSIILCTYQYNAPVDPPGTHEGDIWGYGRLFAYRSHPQGGAFCMTNKLKVCKTFDACLLIQNEVISYDPSMDAGITS